MSLRLLIPKLVAFLGDEEIAETVVSMKDATFSWPPNPEAILSGLQFDLQKGKLLQIVGDVGCGKS